MAIVPITMITGFLGSGKSTLINRILKDKPDTKFGLIVNEFGDVNLESQVLETTNEEVVELSNGCMCCVVRKDIVSAVEKLLASKNKIDYILVEASGLSDPIPIAQTFLMNDLEGKIRLDGVLCLVDAENFEKNMEQFKIAYTQLQAADIVLLSKSDLVDKKQFKKINEFLKTSVSNIAIVNLDKDFHAEEVLDTARFDHSNISELEVYEEKETKHSHQSHTHHHHDENCGCNSHKHSHSNHDKHCNDKNCSHEHHHDTNRVIGSAKDQQEHSHEHHHAHEHVDTVFFKTDKPLNYDKFGNFVKNLSSDVIRAKGFTWFGDSLPPEQDLKYIVQFVGARRQLSYKPWAKNETKQNAIVFIGKKLKKKDLLAQISSCVIKAAQ